MSDWSIILITPDWGRALDIHAYQKLFQSVIIWGNGNGCPMQSPVVPYKNEWKSPLPSHSFLYGRTGDSPLTHGAFRQMWSDLISFRDPSIFNPLPQLCITRIWLRSLIWVECRQEFHTPPPQLRISVSSFMWQTHKTQITKQLEIKLQQLELPNAPTL